MRSPLQNKVYFNDQGSGGGHTLPRGRPYPSQHRPAIRWSRLQDQTSPGLNRTSKATIF